MESYLKEVDPALAYSLIKFRTRTNHLPVTKGRFNEKAIVSCNLCQTGEVGDEIHYLFKCQYFEDLRVKYLPNNLHVYANDKYYELFSLSRNILTGVAKFSKIIMSHFKQKYTRLAPRKIRKTRTGRVIVTPVKLNL